MDKTQKKIFSFAILGSLVMSCCLIYYVFDIPPWRVPALVWAILSNLGEFLEIVFE